MSDVNELILNKLKEYPPSVLELASKALELAQSFPEQSVAEQLKSVVRQIAKRGGLKE